MMTLLLLRVIIYSCRATDLARATKPPYPSISDGSPIESPIDTSIGPDTSIGCQWPYPAPEENSTQPVFLTKNEEDNNFNIAIPFINDVGKPELKLNHNQNLLIVCPKTETATELIMNGHCSQGNLLAPNKDTNLDRFICSSSIKFEKKKLSKKCHESITLSEIGFNYKTADHEKKWIKIVEYCIDPDTTKKRNYYTTHRIFGGPKFLKEIKKFVSEEEEMEDSMESSPETPEKTTDDGLILVHSIPPEDTILKAEKMISDEPDTQIVMWKSVYELQWVEVERLVRQTASMLGGQIKVTTGTHGVKEQNGQKLVFEERLVAPIIWKMIQWETFCVVFAVYNIERRGTHRLCERSMCENGGWKLPERVSCCFLPQFKKAIKEIILPTVDNCEPLRFPRTTPSE